MSGNNAWTPWQAVFVICMIGCCIWGDCNGGGSSGGTDGVFESATEKMDRGQPLNDREKQRIHDILNWCNRCNNTQRMCECD